LTGVEEEEEEDEDTKARQQGKDACKSKVMLPAVPGSAKNPCFLAAADDAATDDADGGSKRMVVLPMVPFCSCAWPISATSLIPARCCGCKPGLLLPARIE
jgi:hypothetical protein